MNVIVRVTTMAKSNHKILLFLPATLILIAVVIGLLQLKTFPIRPSESNPAAAGSISGRYYRCVIIGANGASCEKIKPSTCIMDFTFQGRTYQHGLKISSGRSAGVCPGYDPRYWYIFGEDGRFLGVEKSPHFDPFRESP
jgi:hypothetical protein